MLYNVMPAVVQVRLLWSTGAVLLNALSDAIINILFAALFQNGKWGRTFGLEFVFLQRCRRHDSFLYHQNNFIVR